MEDTLLIGLAVLAFLVAGTVKGTVGVGLPTTSIGLITLFADPRTAIALVLFPMILSNAWQIYRAGEILRALGTYRIFAVCLFLGVGLTTQLTADVSDRVLFGVLGAVVIAFVAISLAITIPPLPARFDAPAQFVMGCVAGLMGGLTAVWAPPMAVYLIARQAPKDEFVRATGLLIMIGTFPLIVGLAVQGHLPLDLAGLSLAMLAPTLAGFALGEALRGRLPEDRFRKILLYVFLILGLNLLRRAFFG